MTQLSGFSDSVPKLQESVRRIRMGAGTSIYDAMSWVPTRLAASEDRRRAIVLVTDGGETTSVAIR